MSIGPQFWRNRSIPVDWRKLDTATEEPRVLDVEVEPIPGTDDAWVKEPGCSRHRMKLVDAVPCTRCSLRGHVAGDPELCRRRVEVLGLGGIQHEQSKIGGAHR